MAVAAGVRHGATVRHWAEAARGVDALDAKGDAMAVLAALGLPMAALSVTADAPGFYHPGRSGLVRQGPKTVLASFGDVHPRVLAALDLLAAQPGRRFAVLGTMLELGEQSLELHRRVAARAAELQLDGLVIVDGGAAGQAMAQAAAPLPRLSVVATPEQAAAPLGAWLQGGDVVLLKASRGVALERLLALLPSPAGPA